MTDALPETQARKPPRTVYTEWMGRWHGFAVRTITVHAPTHHGHVEIEHRRWWTFVGWGARSSRLREWELKVDHQG